MGVGTGMAIIILKSSRRWPAVSRVSAITVVRSAASKGFKCL